MAIKFDVEYMTFLGSSDYIRMIRYRAVACYDYLSLSRSSIIQAV